MKRFPGCRFRTNLRFERLEDRCLLAVFMVTNTDDDGAGSLRAAIDDANAAPNGGTIDEIHFSIGSGAQTIAPLTALPTISDPVAVLGNTQPGYSGVPLIELDGVSQVSGAGLRVAAGSSEIRGLIVNRFSSHGIILDDNDGNIVAGNYIGTDSAGAARRENGGNGILVFESDSNLIGGLSADDRNILSGNFFNGVTVVRSSGNEIQGNYIGLDAAGSTNLANIDGVFFFQSPDNTLGGETAAARNVISGNANHGVILAGATSTNNVIAGNFIGLDAAGDVEVGNGGNGITLAVEQGVANSAATATVIGGVTPGAGNVISGNGDLGIELFRTHDNTIQGNLIGLSADGLSGLPNGTNDALFVTDGIDVFESFNNIIGGDDDDDGALDGVVQARNVISTNVGAGIDISGTASTGNQVLGNYIGTNINGLGDESLPLGNGLAGIAINDGASDNTIGGAEFGAGNLISGNPTGIDIRSGATTNGVLSNVIGLDKNGQKLGNGSGILLEDASGNFIGALTENPGVELGNVISGNVGDGVFITGATTTLNVVLGNFIGVNSAGESVGNGGHGVFIDGAPDNHIGSAEFNIGGLSLKGLNIISANGQDGVRIEGAAATGNRIGANHIGLDLEGEATLGNGGRGVTIQDAPGNSVEQGNVISGNTAAGVVITGAMASGNKLLGNLIGPNADGTIGSGNLGAGLQVFDAPNNEIGAVGADGRNVISGNGEDSSHHAVHIRGTGATGNVILNNYIGLGVDGASGGGGGFGSGIVVEDAVGTRIGGVDPGEGNVIGDFLQQGVLLTTVTVGDPGATGTEIVGNFIGTSADGMQDFGNGVDGIQINNASENYVGLLAPENGGTHAGNVISGNGEAGVVIFGVQPDKAEGNFVQANLIGVAGDGTTPLGNDRYGVLVEIGQFNKIGGLEEGDGNTIAYNGSMLGREGHGVEILFGNGNAIRRNSIHHNSGRGINLGGEGNSFDINDPSDDDGNLPGGMPDPVSPNLYQNYPVVTAVAFLALVKQVTFTLQSKPNEMFHWEFYANSELDPSGFGEGETFLFETETTTDGDGTSQVVLTTVSSNQFISATVTDSNGNTSEFSMVDTDGDALADAWELTGIDFDEDGTTDLVLGSNPNHKDIFVEVDAMVGRAPHLLALPDVVAAFAAAPNNLVQNPDGNPGVTLHAVLDETNVPLVQFPNGLVDADGVKLNRFGTAAERGDANSANILAAKRLVYRWAIFADTSRGDSTSGSGELPGNDFFVTLGAWSTPGGTPGGTREEQAGTFMHELGHTLGLHHGGGDNLKFKPNYHSVMNYTWQVPGNLFPGARPTTPNETAYFNSWVLDYSRSAIPDLDETDLNEAAGIGGHAGHTVRIRSTGAYVPENGRVDWNGDGDSDDVGLMIDLNDDGSMDILSGHEDWSNLQYSFIGTASFADGVSPDVAEDELTFELWESMVDWRALPGDYNLDGVVDAADYTVRRDTLGQTAFSPYSGADGNGNGIVDQADYDLWKSNFGTTLGAMGNNLGGSPVVAAADASSEEPSGLLSLFIGDLHSNGFASAKDTFSPGRSHVRANSSPPTDLVRDTALVSLLAGQKFRGEVEADRETNSRSLRESGPKSDYLAVDTAFGDWHGPLTLRRFVTEFSDEIARFVRTEV